MLLHKAISEYLQENHPGWWATVWFNSRIMIRDDTVGGTMIVIDAQTMIMYSYSIDRDAVVSCNHNDVFDRLSSIIHSS